MENYFKNCVVVTLPIVDVRIRNNDGGVPCSHSPKTTQDKFKNQINFYNSEYLAFTVWQNYYPGVSFDEYKRHPRNYRYRIRAIRVSSVWTIGEHNHEFGVWYYIDDTARLPESSRRESDARHYFIEFMKYVHGEETLNKMNETHQKMCEDKSHWEQHITSTSYTWKF